MLPHHLKGFIYLPTLTLAEVRFGKIKLEHTCLALLSVDSI